MTRVACALPLLWIFGCGAAASDTVHVDEPGSISSVGLVAGELLVRAEPVEDLSPEVLIERLTLDGYIFVARRAALGGGWRVVEVRRAADGGVLDETETLEVFDRLRDRPGVRVDLEQRRQPE